jgi:hypothetical protein
MNLWKVTYSYHSKKQMYNCTDGPFVNYRSAEEYALSRAACPTVSGVLILPGEDVEHILTPSCEKELRDLAEKL